MPVYRSKAALKATLVIFVPLVGTLALWLTSSNQVSAFAAACAFGMAVVPIASYVQWKARPQQSSVPLFSMVAAMYWLSFAMPLFWSEPVVHTVSYPRRVPQNMVELAVFAALIGVLAMWAGFHAGLGRRGKPREFLALRQGTTPRRYLYVLLAAGILIGHYQDLPNAMGEGLRQPLQIVLNFTPLAAFALLLLEYFRGHATREDKIVLVGFVLARATVGLSTGWLGSVLAVGVILLVAYLQKWRRLPALALAFAFALILFLQPGKEAFRLRYWYTADTDGVLDRASYWLSTSTDLWTEAIFDPTSEAWKDLSSKGTDRFNLLGQTGNVLDHTPGIVPYQYGRLYSYLAVTFIPRAIWPDKPSINDANQWYQVQYGISDENDLAHVSIAVGSMAEGYINFGWPGLVGIMFLLGVFLDFFDRILLSGNAGLFANAIGIALVPNLLAIESQLGQYVAGMLQMVVLTTLAMLPALRWIRRARQPQLRVPAFHAASKM